MSQLIPLGKKAVALGVKHGPQAKQAWDVAGRATTEAVKRNRARAQNRRNAFKKARMVAEGSVLRQLHGDQIVWVVYSADEPVASYPEVVADLADLTKHAKLSERITPAEFDEKRARARAKRAAARLRQR